MLVNLGIDFLENKFLIIFAAVSPWLWYVIFLYFPIVSSSVANAFSTLW